MEENLKKLTDFDAIRISIASPEQILSWSHGEVTKPETINYRTQKPERDGLFCERIFGPTKDWECYCGKYKKVRYKGIVCDKCGVEVTRSIVRRERMGHIELAAPVCHIWYLRGVPSQIGLLLNLSTRDLEKVVYFASFIITELDPEKQKEILTKLKQDHQKSLDALEKEKEKRKKELEKIFTSQIKKEKEKAAKKVLEEELKKKLADLEKEIKQKISNLKTVTNQSLEEVKNLAVGKLISEGKINELVSKYGKFFEAKIGAEAILDLLSKIDVSKKIAQLEKEVQNSVGQRKKKALKRLRLFKGLQRAGVKPEWMVLRRIPVLPPDLRPMVQLDGGRYAASDLNDLYRRVINRNNRLKRLNELGAPEVIKRNEKRMLQEAVDALIDNKLRRKPITTGVTRRELKSLSDMLRGKQGRFRQNLLGKRVDYSGRSVIVIGPNLKLYQCGIPKKMALELFKPFVIGQLIKRGYASNIKVAGKLIEAGTSEVWDILEELTSRYLVLLNRAPTLHRLGIQAFQLVLIEGKAIQINPLICAGFNADFDGDQMAVHLPLSAMAQKEARELMLSSRNLLKPAAGEPIVGPSHEIILGCYYITSIVEGKKGEGKCFSSFEEALYAYEIGAVDIQAKVKIKIKGKLIETSVGRAIFNAQLPEGMPYLNEVMDKKALKKVIAECFNKFGLAATAKLVDRIKELGFKFATKAGYTISMDDILIPKEKLSLLSEAEKKTEEVENQYRQGLITDEERYSKIIEIWTETTEKVEKAVLESFGVENPVYASITSGARGSISQLTQLAGMKGLVVNPAGQTIELPIKSNFKEGLSVLEYFISTHGARKGRSDIALRTSDAGYLTRRLIDVCQDVIVTEEDCGTEKGIEISKEESEAMGRSFAERILGRILQEDVIDPRTKKVLVSKGSEINEENVDLITSKVDKVLVRSVLTCEAFWGVCQKCYGRDLARGGLIKKGEAVGIIAAQAIGEPGTQLTMRTFHTGGVVGLDITQGLPRAEELFEARTPKSMAYMAEIKGKVSIDRKPDKTIIKIEGLEPKREIFMLPKGVKPTVKEGQKVEPKTVIAKGAAIKPIKVKKSGKIAKIESDKIVVIYNEKPTREYLVPPHINILVKPNQIVEVGEPLTEGHLDLHLMYRLLGKEAVEKYIISEIQGIYASQGQAINDKHIEVVIRQMFSKIKIIDPGDSNFLPGEIVNKWRFREENEILKKANKKEAKGEELLLGITKASLNTDSFLSAASFQETTSVLIQAAVSGKIDRLMGLKENTIIGRLIPAGTGFSEKRLEFIKLLR